MMLTLFKVLLLSQISRVEAGARIGKHAGESVNKGVTKASENVQAGLEAASENLQEGIDNFGVNMQTASENLQTGIYHAAETVRESVDTTERVWRDSVGTGDRAFRYGVDRTENMMMKVSDEVIRVMFHFAACMIFVSDQWRLQCGRSCTSFLSTVQTIADDYKLLMERMAVALVFIGSAISSRLDLQRFTSLTIPQSAPIAIGLVAVVHQIWALEQTRRIFENRLDEKDKELESFSDTRKLEATLLSNRIASLNDQFQQEKRQSREDRADAERTHQQQITELEDRKNAEISEKATTITQKHDEIYQKDAEISRKDAEIFQKNAGIVRKDAEISRKNAEITGKDAEISRKDSEIAKTKTNTHPLRHAGLGFGFGM